MTRRTAAWLAGVAAILPLVFLSPPVEAAPATPAGAFTPPQTRMVLTRTVRRPLSGGRELVVRRSYEVQIVADGPGYRVDGQLTGCTVEAPESLKALAEIERNRPETSLFPIALDGKGNILSSAPARPNESLDRAADLVSGRLETIPLSPMDLEQARAFVRQVQARAAGSQWPADLFHPVPGRRTETKTIPLPGGERGSVAVEVTAQDQQSGGLLGSLERIVVTELEGDRRVTREEWTLASAS